ncbi:hypothetical protein [Ectopseudomonas hydrolytica]|uniref:hypothetical protein n=1 Tax=Ectopseudomonas hydrolytica TaxID=2493633 RepID=UPI0020B66BF9|nr:hypothetical protein [Pseudomonas hydrolytica]UTH34280.1 hypothetical protein NLY38_25785 [Pseudomonas hydrolytica]UZZ13593.1 hypothetical protein NDO41_26970 [Pseudomonas mendocina]
MNTKEIETRIIRQAAQSLIDAGYWLQAQDGEEAAGERTRSAAAILAECFATDITNVIVYESADAKRSKGWVQFVHGNGVDVVSDYTVNLEAEMAAASDLAERLG